jgi:hypothetical protein
MGHLRMLLQLQRLQLKCRIKWVNDKPYIRIWKKIFVVYFKIPLGTDLVGEECSEEAQDNVTGTQTSYVAGSDAPMLYALCMTHVSLHTS